MPDEAALLERDHELTELTRAVASAAAGDGRLVIVEGEAGVGKTALVEATGAVARAAGMQVLAARGSALEHDFAHGIVRQLFELPVLALGSTERRAVLKGPAAVAAALLGWDEAAGSPPALTDATFAAVHGLYWLAANLASGTPLLLVVDDAQWADVASLRWLNYLAHGRLGGLPICIVVAWRTGEPEAPEELLRALRSEPGVQRLAPRRLSEPGSAELLRRVLGTDGTDDALCALCHDRTGGNPFLLVELARALASEGSNSTGEWFRLAARLGPENIRQTMLLRLAPLPPEAAALARAVAVLDSDAASRHAAGLAELSSAQLAAHAARLSAAGLITPGPTLRFAHPILRTVIYEDMTPQARAIAHRRAADLLACAGAADQAAVHLLQTEPAADAATVELLRHTARRHLAQGAPDAAVPLLSRALAECPAGAADPELRYELGHAEMIAGNADAVVQLRAAHDHAADPQLRSTAARELAGALAASGHADEALALLCALADELAGSELALAVEADAAAVAQVSGRLRAQHTERLGQAAEHASGATPAGRRLLVAYAYSGVADATMTAAQVATLIDRASASGEVFADDEASLALSPSLPWAIACEVAVDRLDQAALHARRELERGRARGAPLSVLTCAGYLARLAYLQADVRTAEVEARVALQAAEAIAPTYYLDWPVSQLALALVELDRPAESLQLLERYGFAAATLPRGLFAAHFLAEARLATWLALGRRDRAAVDADLLRKLGRGASSPLLARRGLVAEALLTAGRRADAQAVAEAELAAAA
ncbi:MAG TPA: ATP-binding protein, partial [Jatrophihabitans sp.]|nr:ATP-binding protein [Jatrophihabitans sp.]